ncbi:DUF5777 family beta-barrel protein [Pedobacter immunditicola]|uniref:DUF5777 family beta-barrel protein n=1 Tax=Pedobacter immunditicola TaxID=3133440 RepID=UPI0030948A32
MKLMLLFIFTCIFSAPLKAQDDLSKLFKDTAGRQGRVPVIATFKSPQIINGQSNETTPKSDLLFVVMHRFGDVGGSNGGVDNFFGLDNSTDILIGFNYGISDKLSTGLGRVKGAPNGTGTDQRQLVYLNLKYRLLQQTEDNYIPVSLTLFGNAAVSVMEKSDLQTSDAAFTDFGDRMSYVSQVIIARKFNDNVSFALTPTYVRRNYVPFMDKNNTFALGVGARVKFTKRMAIVADYFHNFRTEESKDYFLTQKDFRFYDPLGIGLEIETGGHVFNLIFTNATAILENQYVPNTSSSWTKGEFRWGFSISRTFTLSKDKKNESKW